MLDEIEFLVNETFKHHKENYEQEKSFFSDGPGVISYIDKSPSSLRAYCLASENLQEDGELYEQLPSSFSEFKGAALSELVFHPCSLNEARYIKEHVHAKRFYLQDDLASNLMSPSDYWWLTKKDNRIEISFNSQRSDNAIRLGPLGDKKISREFFNCGYEFVETSLLIDNYNVSDSGIGFDFNSSNPLSFDLLKLFEKGVVGEDLDEFMKLPSYSPVLKRFFSYLRMLGAVRSYWLKITSEH